jgi:hypothetical protein
LAANAVSYGHDDGLSFIDQRPPVERTVQLKLRYRVDPLLADGALFLPRAMEHKWAVFHHLGRLLFVRSWQRSVVVTASTNTEAGWVEVVDAQGVFTEADEPPTFTEAAVDFLIRTHALHLPHPAPLAADPGDDLRGAALWSFSMFGSFAHFATHHRFSLLPPEVPLRSLSLFHIAVARGALAAAQAQLDLGVPIGLLAGGRSTSSPARRHGRAVTTTKPPGRSMVLHPRKMVVNPPRRLSKLWWATWPAKIDRTRLYRVRGRDTLIPLACLGNARGLPSSRFEKYSGTAVIDDDRTVAGQDIRAEQTVCL